MTDTLIASVDQVEANAHAAWISTALDIVHGLCRDRRYFTTDDVHEILDGRDVWTHDKRAMGAVMRQAARNGWCQATPEYEESGRAIAHKSPKRVWRSLLSTPSGTTSHLGIAKESVFRHDNPSV